VYWLTQGLSNFLPGLASIWDLPNISFLGTWFMEEFFFFWWQLLGFQLRALCLLSWHSTTWTKPPALFALVILEIGFCFLCPGVWTLIFLFYSSHHCWRNRHTPPYPAFSVKMGI
jgi:hypothetical protein